MQFDSRLGDRRLQRLYIGGDVDGLDVGELANTVPLDPGEEVARGPVIGHARVLVTDGDGEELEEAARGMLADVGNHRRYRECAPRCRHLDRRRGVDHRRQVAPLGAHGDTLL